ncbi:MAG: hypothetical protein HFACDABA_01322 [Anaerolineales bacterium]|nr:hypothetical protein [Anaerolineales bacterium]
MSDTSKWIEKVFDNKNLLIHLTISSVCFLFGILLIISGLVKFFPPINPYGYTVSDVAGNVLLIAGSVLIILSVVIYILGSRRTQETVQQIKGGISYLYLRQYLSSRVDAKFDAANKSNVIPTPKSVANISYLLSESISEIALLRTLSPHLILLLEEESDDRIATEIVEIIGKIKIPNSEKILIDNYKRDYLDLKIACVIALGELGTIKSRRSLEKWLENPYKLDGRLLNAMNVSIKKLVIPYEYFMVLKNQLFDGKIAKNIRESYVQSALIELGTDEAIDVVDAYQLSKAEGLDVGFAYQQIIAKKGR